MDRNTRTMVEKLIGIAAIFSNAVGLFAVLFAMIALLNSEFTAAGLSLIAAALGFGLFSIAALSH